MIRRSWISMASVGFVVVGVAAVSLRAFASGGGQMVWTTPVHRIGQGPWSRVFDDAMSLHKAKTYYVSGGQIVFSRSGHLKTSYWSLDAALTNGRTVTIGVNTVGLGRFDTLREPASSSSVSLGPTPAQLSNFLRSSALVQWCTAHPADEYMLRILPYTSNITPQGAPILAFVDGQLFPGHPNALPYTVSLIPLERMGQSHTASGPSVSYRGGASVYLEF